MMVFEFVFVELEIATQKNIFELVNGYSKATIYQ
jgi:hypothetical protein